MEFTLTSKPKLLTRDLFQIRIETLSQCADRVRDNGSKLREGRFTLDRRRKFSIVKEVKHWNRLPRVAVDAWLHHLKDRLEGALNDNI